MRVWRLRVGRRPGPPDWRGAVLWGLSFLGAGVALACSMPLAGRITLLRHAEGYVPTTMVVQAVVTGRRTGRGRVLAQGQLADGRPATVALTGLADPPPRTLAALEAHTGRRPAVLDVAVNEALADGWMRRHRVRLQDPGWREQERADALKLGSLVVLGMGLAIWSVARLRRMQ